MKRSPMALRVLVAAREMIATPDKWCQGHLGLTADGRDTTGATDDTVKRCAAGALNAAAKIHRANRAAGWRPLTVALLASQKGRRFGGIANFNNAQPHAAVLALFDAAIALETTAA